MTKLCLLLFGLAAVVVNAAWVVEWREDSFNANGVVVRNAIKAINAHNLDDVMKAFASDASVSTPCESKLCTTTGKMAIRALMSADFKAFPDKNMEIENLICQDNVCMIKHRASFTHMGTWRTLAPFGKRITDWPAMGEFRFDHGKIVEARVFFDFHGIVERLTPNSERDQLMQQAWRMGEIWNGIRSVDELFTVLAPDFKGTSPRFMNSSTETLSDVGREIVLWRSSFPDLIVTWKASKGTSARELFVQWTMKGTFTNKFAAIEPNNQAITLEGVSINQFNEKGLVETSTCIYDPADLLKQLGVQLPA